MSRLIDADALIADLEYDVELDARALDCLDNESRRDIIQFDKDCKQNAIDLLRKAPTAQPEQCEWIPKEVENVPYGLLVECSKCGVPNLLTMRFIINIVRTAEGR